MDGDLYGLLSRLHKGDTDTEDLHRLLDMFEPADEDRERILYNDVLGLISRNYDEETIRMFDGKLVDFGTLDMLGYSDAVEGFENRGMFDIRTDSGDYSIQVVEITLRDGSKAHMANIMER